MQRGARPRTYDRDRVVVQRASCAWRISMKIEYIPVRELRPYPNNARTHSKKQIQQIAKSITKLDFHAPVPGVDLLPIVDKDRVAEAKLCNALRNLLILFLLIRPGIVPLRPHL